MEAERRERLKALLLEGEALDATARAEWLARLRATEPEMAVEVAALLDAPIRPELRGEGLARAMSQALAEASPSITDLPRDVGPYRLLELIGEGGMGVVYRAEQAEPFHREVAVKALRGGWRPAELRERISAERRALAMMEHPGIARLYDAVVDATGTPYLVMELVRGEPITTYVRSHALETRALLNLFVSACRAVQHAHQRGIIHRDLKPANLLVTLVDGQPVIKVIDFGVARLMADDDEHARLTRAGQVVGTLDYMSPEQASGNTVEADTRSDVYSLGVVLYELLCGQRPHDTATVPAHEAARRIAQAAVRPLRQAAGSARVIASDLEVIVHKAIEQDPERRYDGPGVLADDLERFLRDEPITARPPSAAYQVRVLVRRHRVAVLAGALLLTVLVLFGITMAVLYQGQSRARQRASLEAEKAAAINRFLLGVLESPDPQYGTRSMTVKELLDSKLAALPADLGGEPEVMAEVQAALGRTYSALGEYSRADSLLGLALAVSRMVPADPTTTIRLLLDLAKNAQRDGRFAESRERATEAVELSRAWERRKPDAAAGAATLRSAGLCVIGEALLSEGRDPLQTESTLLEAVAIERRLNPTGSPELAEALLRLGRLYLSVGPWPRADSVLRQAMALSERADGPGHPRQVEILASWGAVQRLLGHPNESALMLADAAERARRLQGAEHATMGPVLNLLASTLMDLDRNAEAESLLVSAIEALQRSPAYYQEDMSTAHRNLAALFLSIEDTASATALSRKAITLSRRYNGADHWLEIQPRRTLAQILSLERRLPDAEREAREGLMLSVRHRGTTNERTLDVMSTLAFVLLGAGEADSARALAEELAREQPGKMESQVLMGLTAPDPGGKLDPRTLECLEDLSRSHLAGARHAALESARALQREGRASEAAHLRRNLAAGRAALRAQLRPEAHAQALAIARAAMAGGGSPGR